MGRGGWAKAGAVLSSTTEVAGGREAGSKGGRREVQEVGEVDEVEEVEEGKEGRGGRGEAGLCPAPRPAGCRRYPEEEVGRDGTREA